MFIGGVLLSLLSLMVVYHAIFFCVGIVRQKYFPEELIKKFETYHSEEVGTALPKTGNPDSGCGRFSQEMDYGAWVGFNNWQRVQMNFYESLTAVVIFMFVSGVAYADYATYLGIGYVVGRIIYSVGYTYGATYRVVGALILDVCVLALIVMSFFSVANMDFNNKVVLNSSSTKVSYT